MQEGICEVLPNVDTGYLQKQVCYNETLNLIIALYEAMNKYRIVQNFDRKVW